MLDSSDRRFVATVDLIEVISCAEFRFPAPFACIVWEHRDSSPSPNQVALFAERVLDLGCRYFLAAGKHADLWEAVFDEVLTTPGRYDPAHHVMTTSHSGEPPEEVAFFAVNCTSFDDLHLQQHLVVHAGRTHLADELELHLTRYASQAT